MSATGYMDLINCSTPEEVYGRVREWSSDLSEHEHVVRSTILDIHTEVELKLKQVLFHSLKSLIFNGDGEEEHEKHCQELERMVTRLSLNQVHQALQPALKAAPHEEFDDIRPINEVRNSLAHSRDLSKVTYKNRSPFNDPDALAQLFFEGWAVRQQLGEFYEHMIAEPRVLAEHYAKFYAENYHRVERINNQDTRESGRV